MTTYEERQQLLAASKELRETLQSITKPVWSVINALESAADGLKVAAADEVDQNGKPAARIVTYTNVRFAPPVEGKPLPYGNEPKRTCSVCRKPGHRAPNCPEAHLIHAEKQAKVAARDAKRAKPKREISPERKAQLVETLKKARAAKKRA